VTSAYIRSLYWTTIGFLHGREYSTVGGYDRDPLTHSSSFCRSSEVAIDCQGEQP